MAYNESCFPYVPTFAVTENRKEIRVHFRGKSTVVAKLEPGIYYRSRNKSSFAIKKINGRSQKLVAFLPLVFNEGEVIEIQFQAGFRQSFACPGKKAVLTGSRMIDREGHIIGYSFAITAVEGVRRA